MPIGKIFPYGLKPGKCGQRHGSYLAGVSEADQRAYLTSRYGSEWHPVSGTSLPSPFTALLMDDFRPGIGCCTLTALTAIFAYFQQTQAGQDDPPQKATQGSHTDLFARVEKQAVRHGYSLTRGRVNPLRIAGLIRSIWHSLGLPGTAHSRYWLNKRLILRELDAGRPALLNIAFGPYRRHTVTLFGYACWQETNRDQPRTRLLLQVADGWNREPRWIDYTAMTTPWSGNFSFLSLTLIRPLP